MGSCVTTDRKQVVHPIERSITDAHPPSPSGDTNVAVLGSRASPIMVSSGGGSELSRLSKLSLLPMDAGARSEEQRTRQLLCAESHDGGRGRANSGNASPILPRRCTTEDWESVNAPVFTVVKDPRNASPSAPPDSMVLQNISELGTPTGGHRILDSAQDFRRMSNMSQESLRDMMSSQLSEGYDSIDTNTPVVHPRNLRQNSLAVTSLNHLSPRPGGSPHRQKKMSMVTSILPTEVTRALVESERMLETTERRQNGRNLKPHASFGSIMSVQTDFNDMHSHEEPSDAVASALYMESDRTEETLTGTSTGNSYGTKLTDRSLHTNL